MTHKEKAALLLGFASGKTRELNVNNIIPFGDVLHEHIDDFEAAVDLKGFKYCGDTYRNDAGTETNPYLMQALILFAYARESLLAKSE